MTNVISETREESKCGGCNWETTIFYSFDSDVKEDKESWLCATCMIEVINENNYDIDTREITEVSEISDELSHELENKIDLVMDKIQDESIKTELRSIRDAIPCSCGNEEEEEKFECMYCHKKYDTDNQVQQCQGWHEETGN